MFESPRSRAGALVVLLVVLGGLLVWYGTLGPAPTQGAYPDVEHYANAPAAYLGDLVETTGRVVDSDPVRIAVDRPPKPPVTLTVTGVSHPVREGGNLWVFGRLTGPREIAATNTFFVPQSGIAYTYGVSFLAGLWVLARIVRTWRFDPEGVGLAPREEPLGLPGSWQPEEGDDSA